MKDKLHYKRPSYYVFVEKGRLWHEDFKAWLKLNPRFKQFSKNRQAYYFILKVFGRFTIKMIREKVTNMDDLIRILKTPWINLPEGD